MSKPVFYTFPASVWAGAGELAIAELGYTDATVDVRVINLVEGANFEPEFLKTNPHETLPTLVADEKAYTSTKDVISYLGEHASKKVAKGTAFIDKVHEEKYDPNLPMLLARNEEELKAHASGFQMHFVQSRQNSLDHNSTLPEAAQFSEFYAAKKAGNGGVLAIYKGEVPEEAKRDFFKHADAHWGIIVSFILEDLPAALSESEDDFHLGAWLARIVFLTGGKLDKEGYKSLEQVMKQPVPGKVAAYWSAWVERPGFQKVYTNGLH
ncbi:hypothetical protein C8Q80DRAFT_1215807 [Daedaleopsis nitida]|nr:hypothetical protein C8Q80DRAFT_1215807 [Daedaleopsis nitida]